MKNEEKCDVVVVGGGTAAFAAAVSARIHGADHVLMLEKAPESNSGGNARYSVTGFRFVHEGAKEIREFLPYFSDAEFERMHHPPYRSEDFFDDLQRVSRGRIDTELAEKLINESNNALHWLLELGHEFEPMTLVVIDGISYFGPGHNVKARGGGIQQLMRWRNIATSLGIDLRYESRVTEIYGNDRKVEGLRVSAPDGEYDLKSDAVILCAGGFQASAEKRAKYLGKNADLMKVRGNRHNTGEVLEMALKLGAQSSGQWQWAHATPISKSAPDVESGDDYDRYSYPLGITINATGGRFFDEGEAESTYTYAKTGWALLGQPEGIGYQIYDQQTVPYIRPIYALETPIQAETLEELAAKLGIEPTILIHTVQEFNNSVSIDVEFTFPRKDGKNTVNLPTPKSNWAVKIETPPFLAYPVTGGITFTFGGLQVNTNAQVMNTCGTPIHGLYASGDILGLFYHNYPSCTGQTRNAVFGRLAGQHAVESFGKAAQMNSTGG